MIGVMGPAFYRTQYVQGRHSAVSRRDPLDHAGTRSRLSVEDGPWGPGAGAASIGAFILLSPTAARRVANQRRAAVFRMSVTRRSSRRSISLLPSSTILTPTARLPRPIALATSTRWAAMCSSPSTSPPSRTTCPVYSGRDLSGRSSHDGQSRRRDRRGHTVTDPEPKYGLCVTGTVHPDRILTKAGAKLGDRLFLTKPLGTGAITTAMKNQAASAEAAQAAIESMLRLNRQASELARVAGGQRLHRHYGVWVDRPWAGDGDKERRPPGDRWQPCPALAGSLGVCRSRIPARRDAPQP